MIFVNRIFLSIEHYMDVTDPYAESPSLEDFWKQIRSLDMVQLQFPMAELTIGDYKQIVERAESLLSKPRALELAKEASSGRATMSSRFRPSRYGTWRQL